jgi:hypothetical protein
MGAGTTRPSPSRLPFSMVRLVQVPLKLCPASSLPLRELSTAANAAASCRAACPPTLPSLALSPGSAPPPTFLSRRQCAPRSRGLKFFADFLASFFYLRPPPQAFLNAPLHLLSSSAAPGRRAISSSRGGPTFGVPSISLPRLSSS